MSTASCLPLAEQSVMDSPVLYRHTTRPTTSPDSPKGYFGVYLPLSSLPTPPMSSSERPFCDFTSPATDENGYPLDTELLGAAQHLSNLIPPAACRSSPSSRYIHELLRRANVPKETIALAACILDSLSSRFASTWRRICSCTTSYNYKPSRALSQPPTCSASPLSRETSLWYNPEIIVLAAIMVSVKFLDDDTFPTMYWQADIAQNRFSCKEINATECALLQDLGYSILPLCSPEIIRDSTRDIQSVTKFYFKQPSFPPQSSHHTHHTEEALVWGHEVRSSSS
ncbi:MAG: hypothetical protein M1829_005471 [Trizodia sp. TS-e1964]|nr:MAG: hypothetical protein M1829_005471 [Trizodia sp. TS-e1964]